MEIQMGGAVDVAGTGRIALYYGNLNGWHGGVPGPYCHIPIQYGLILKILDTFFDHNHRNRL